jgi:hypothetical protein
MAHFILFGDLSKAFTFFSRRHERVKVRRGVGKSLAAIHPANRWTKKLLFAPRDVEIANFISSSCNNTNDPTTIRARKAFNIFQNEGAYASAGDRGIETEKLNRGRSPSEHRQ